MRETFADAIRRRQRRHQQQREWIRWALDGWVWPEQKRALDLLAACGTTWVQFYQGREIERRRRCGHPLCWRCQNWQNQESPIQGRASRDAIRLLEAAGTAYAVTLDIGWPTMGDDLQDASRGFRRRLRNLLDRYMPAARMVTYDHLEQSTQAPGLLHWHCHGVLVTDLPQAEVEALLRRVSDRVHMKPVTGNTQMGVEAFLRYGMNMTQDGLDRTEWLQVLASVESLRGASGRGQRWTYGIRTQGGYQTVSDHGRTDVNSIGVGSMGSGVSSTVVPYSKAQPLDRLPRLHAIRTRLRALADRRVT